MHKITEQNKHLYVIQSTGILHLECTSLFADIKFNVFSMPVKKLEFDICALFESAL